MDFSSALTLFIILFIIFSVCGFCCRSKRKGTIFSSINFPWGLIVFIIIIILFSICTHCCKEDKRRHLYATPVVVTSATHTAPGGYPTGMQTVAVYPTAQGGTAYQQSVYPQQVPYPVSGAPSAMPMPQMQLQMQPNPIGMNQQMMPPYPMAGPGMNPPSYESAVGPNPNAYEKQSPYNPGYAAGH